jgi:hypothetical protein
MRQLHAFELENRPDSPSHPAEIKIALLRYSPGRDGCSVITLACTPYEEVEGPIKFLQKASGEIRE